MLKCFSVALSQRYCNFEKGIQKAATGFAKLPFASSEFLEKFANNHFLAENISSRDWYEVKDSNCG